MREERWSLFWDRDWLCFWFSSQYHFTFLQRTVGHCGSKCRASHIFWQVWQTLHFLPSLPQQEFRKLVLWNDIMGVHSDILELHSNRQTKQGGGDAFLFLNTQWALSGQDTCPCIPTVTSPITFTSYQRANVRFNKQDEEAFWKSETQNVLHNCLTHA